MNTKWILLFGGMLLLVSVMACGPVATPQQSVTATPTACATTAAVPPSGVATSTAGGRTTPPAYPQPVQPTLSAAEQATMQARLGNANPGAPTTPAGGPNASSLPPCPTPTPIK